MFTQLTQCFEVLQKLECQDPEIWKRYMKRFAKTVVKVLTEYSNVLQNDFHNHVRDESKVNKLTKDKIFMLKNNYIPVNLTYHACDLNLQKQYFRHVY